MRIHRKKRNGNRAWIDVSFDWKPKMLEFIKRNKGFGEFVGQDFVNDYYSGINKSKYLRRIRLLNQSGWLGSKKQQIIKGRKKFRVYHLSKKARDYLKKYFYFNNQKGYLYTYNKFLNPKPEVVEKIVEVEKPVIVEETSEDSFIGEM